MAEAVDQLKREHEALKRMMQVVDKMCSRLRSGSAVELEHLDQIQEFFKVFADQCHHEKEEKVLFPALKEAGVPIEEGPIAVMLKEHTMMRGCIERLGKAIARYKAGDKNAVSLIVQNAINHNELLLMHMSKEDNILFAIVETRLSDDQKKEVAQKYAVLEAGKIRPGESERFYRCLGSLEAVYLKG